LYGIAGKFCLYRDFLFKKGKHLRAAEIRKAFLNFFTEKKHFIVPSSSLIPAGDPTLLLTNAGMVQFKPYFTGEVTPPQPRLSSVQKCFRVSDIDSVGDTSHLTFFEMLGNFSVGDYFKKDAIAWSWEFITEHLHLDPELLWATVFLDDDEAQEIWEETGIPGGRIRRFGEKDNWWGPAGSEGPCGPCSEIHYDLGGECRFGKPLLSTDGRIAASCGPNCECGRFLELWNLVFMQFYQDSEGGRTLLSSPNIDTGMGLERATLILEGAASIYETELFLPIVQEVARLGGVIYGRNHDEDVAIRVVAEHVRAATFLIADGVLPGNEGRGYVLRRLIRRAIFFAMRLMSLSMGVSGQVELAASSELQDGQKQLSLASLISKVVEVMSGVYTELEPKETFIEEIVSAEEESFHRTLREGVRVLRQIISLHVLVSEHWEDVNSLNVAVKRLRQADGLGGILPAVQKEVLEPLLKAKSSGALKKSDMFTINGSELFLLHSTYGFPFELTREAILTYSDELQAGTFEVDEDDFYIYLEKDRKRARAASGFQDSGQDINVYRDLAIDNTRFLGYEVTASQSVVIAIMKNHLAVQTASEGEQVGTILSETPFYPEGGGQVGDTGLLEGPQGKVQVRDTQSPRIGLIVHRSHIEKGTISVGDPVTATVDPLRRLDIARNHTATHLLHAALREVLGTHVRQQGSLVAQDRLRFDFTHINPLSMDQVEQVQGLVNDRIRANILVRKTETAYREALEGGALAFFGDKYGDQVRVVEMANGHLISLEMCGGTHVDATGDIGFCKITSESSIGSGLRRIEAVTGRVAETVIRDQHYLIERVAHRLEVTPQDLESRVTSLVEEVAQMRRQVSTQERISSIQQAQALLEKIEDVKGINVVCQTVQVNSVEGLREIADWVRNKVGSILVILGTVVKKRPAILVAATQDLVGKGIHAGDVVKEAANVIGGGGGGRAEMAQAGGHEASKLGEAILTAKNAAIRQAGI
jgi:alanyl-tRNA synthetase